MNQQYTVVEDHLAIGTGVMFQSVSGRIKSPWHKTTLRGWRAPHHLLYDIPNTEQGNFIALLAGQACTVRFLHEGVACAYDSWVIDWDTRQHSPYLRLRWPDVIRSASCRKSERIKSACACRVTRPDGTVTDDDVVCDLSLGGCGFHTSTPCEKNSTITLDITLPDSTRAEGIALKVLNIRQEDDRYFIGGQFIPDQAVVDMDIAYYVLSTLDMQRSGSREGDKPRVLIVHEDLDTCRSLQAALKEEMTVFMASNGLDGMHRLRATLPDIAIVSPTLPYLNGPDLCHLVRHLKEFNDLPLYIFGGDAATLEACTQAGATAGFSATQEVQDTLLDTSVPAEDNISEAS